MKLFKRGLVVALVSVLATAFVPASAEDSPPHIDVQANKTVYVAGQTAEITVVVSGAGSGKYLRLTVTRADGSTAQASTGAYDDTFHYNFAMYIDSSLKTELIDADQTTVLQTDQKVFPVQAKVSSVVGGYFQRSGSYVIFAKGAEPVFRSATIPAHAGRCIKHEVWRQYASGWKPILLSSCKLENSQGWVTWRWLGTHGSGVNFRVRAKFLGDRLNHPNAGRFIYFRFK